MQDRYGDERAPLSEMVPVMVREGRRRVLPMAAVFCLIAVAALLVGMSWPRKYFATTSILVAEDNIIQQLMEGRAVPTGINDRALIAKEVIFSRKVTDDLLEHGGWLADEPSAAERDALTEAMRSRTVIGSPRENLIQIQYWIPIRSAPTRSPSAWRRCSSPRAARPRWRKAARPTTSSPAGWTSTTPS